MAGVAGRVALTLPDGSGIIWSSTGNKDRLIDALYKEYGPTGEKKYASRAEAEKDILRPIRAARLESMSASGKPESGELLYETKEIPATYFAGMPEPGKPYDFLRKLRVPGISSALEWYRGGPQYWSGENAPIAALPGALGESTAMFAPTGPEYPEPGKPQFATPEAEGAAGPEVVGPLPAPFMIERRFRGATLPFLTQTAALMAGGEMTRGMNSPTASNMARFVTRPAIMGASGVAGGTIGNIERQWAQGQQADADKALMEGGLQSGLAQGALGLGLGVAEGAMTKVGTSLIRNAYRRMPVKLQELAKKYGGTPTAAWLEGNEQTVSGLNAKNLDDAASLDQMFPTAGQGIDILPGLQSKRDYIAKFGTKQTQEAFDDVIERVATAHGGRRVEYKYIAPSNEWTLEQRAHFALTGKPHPDVIKTGVRVISPKPITFSDLMAWRQELNRSLEMENAAASAQGSLKSTSSKAAKTPAARAIKAQMDEIDNLLYSNRQFRSNADARRIVENMRARNREMFERLSIRDAVNVKMLSPDLISARIFSGPAGELAAGRRFVSTAPSATRVVMPTVQAGGAFVRTRDGKYLPMRREAVPGWQRPEVIE